MAHNGCSQYRVRGHCDCCLQADNVFAAGKEEHSHLDPTLYTRVRVRVSKKTSAMSKKGVIVLEACPCEDDSVLQMYKCSRTFSWED